MTFGVIHGIEKNDVWVNEVQALVLKCVYELLHGAMFNTH